LFYQAHFVKEVATVEVVIVEVEVEEEIVVVVAVEILEQIPEKILDQHA
jgi:hypothetical protein